jgi:formiminotetrahydrofolate cyclodeaminase
MVCGLTLRRQGDAQAPLDPVRQEAEKLRHELTALVEEDARAYQKVMEAYRLPKASPEEKEARSAAVQRALDGAARVPLSVAEAAVKVLELVPPVLDGGLSSAASDAGVAAYMAQAALKGAALNVLTNLASLQDKKRYQAQLSSLEARAQELMTTIEKTLAKGA